MPKGRFASLKGLGTKNRAPMVETDIHELGDLRLDPKESVVREREALIQKASIYKIEDQDELTNQKRSEGARIPYGEFLSRLEKLAPQLTAKDAIHDNLALYFPRKPKELEAAIREGSGGSGNDLFFLMNKYVGGFPKVDLPEWGFLDRDTSLIATREHLRGWRTVLIGLILTSVISYQEAIDEFGDPVNDPRNTVWMKKTLEWRQNPTARFTLREYLEAKTA